MGGACVQLEPFQTRFLLKSTAASVDTAALSLPRGNGKSSLAGHIIARILTPADSLFTAGSESVLCAASIEQARICFKFARDILEPTGEYSFLDSVSRIGVRHKATNTRFRVISSSGKTAMGLVGCPWAVCDEPGAWETRGGELMWNALATAQGKPGSPLRILIIGTLAPAMNGWWHDLVKAGSHGSTYVQLLQGDLKLWDRESEIGRCNPLSAIDAKFLAKLLEERDAALADSRLKARFLSYRLNIPSGDESQMLLTVDDWQRACGRAVAPAQGHPIVGIDLGAGRAWSAAVALWRNGRTEAIAVAPGIPSIEDQEKRDRVPTGTYQALLDQGRLLVAEGLRVPTPRHLLDAMRDRGWQPEVIFCDRFRLPELQDAAPPCPHGFRASPDGANRGFDIRALRKYAKDGPLSVETGS